MFYSWSFGALILLFIASEIATAAMFPNIHVGRVLGTLRYLPLVLTAIIGFAACLLVLRSVRQWIGRIAFDKLGSQAVAPTSIIRDLRVSRETIIDLTIAAMGSMVLEGFTLYLCLTSIGVNPPLVLVFLGFCFARFFSMLPLTPGGVGEIEAGLVLFFAAYGYSLTQVFTAAVMYRLMTYWPPLLIGSATLGLRNSSLGTIPGIHAREMHGRERAASSV